MGINVRMYNLFEICSSPHFPNRIEKISELRNFVKVGGGGAAPQYSLSNAPGLAQVFPLNFSLSPALVKDCFFGR